MWRLISSLIVLALIIAAAVWMADRPGKVVVDWLAWRVETSVPVLFLAILLLTGGLFLCFRLISGLVGLPDRWRSSRKLVRQRKGYRALTDGLAAAAAGQSKQAGKHARRAERLLDDPAVTRLLAAQSAQLTGDDETAQDHFQAMLERPETEELGLRALLRTALLRQDTAAAIDLAQRARSLAPADPGLAETLFGLLIRAGRLADAQDLVTDARRRKAFSAAMASHRKALVLNARAAGEIDAAAALALARQAVAADPGFTDAALRLARLTAEAGRRQRAATVLETAWRHCPVLEIAQAYRALVPDETPLDRLRRLEKLVGSRPDDSSSHLVLGEAALQARLWGLARKHLTAAAARPTAAPYRLLAQLELAEYNDSAASHRWLDQAATAPADPSWQCGSCATTAMSWQISCPQCGTVDSLSWKPLAAAPRLLE